MNSKWSERWMPNFVKPLFVPPGLIGVGAFNKDTNSI